MNKIEQGFIFDAFTRDHLSEPVQKPLLVSNEWVENHSLPPGVDPREPQVMSLLSRGVKVSEIVVISLGR